MPAAHQPPPDESLTAGIESDRWRLAEFCRRNHVRRLALFGSVLRDDFRPDSDVDVLVEFEPGRVPGFLRLAGVELDLSEMLGRDVGLRTAADLSPWLREEVAATAQSQYSEQ